jgi:hypothetical protein
VSEPLVCPVCRAANEQPPACRRCRADLLLLWQVRDERDRVLAAAREQLRGGDLDSALASVRRAEELHRTPETQRLRALVHLLRHEFRAARECCPQ